MRLLYYWAYFIFLVLVKGREDAYMILNDLKLSYFKKQIEKERDLHKINTELKKIEQNRDKEIAYFKQQLIEHIKRVEKNEEIREKYFGVNHDRSESIKNRNKNKWDKYFGENGKYT